VEVDMRGARISAFVVFCSLAAPRLIAQASAAPDPCSLLTAAEVSSVVGIKSLAGRPYLGSKRVCLFSPDTSADSEQPVVNLMVETPAMYQAAKNTFPPHPVSGLGDEAYWSGSGSYAKVAVRKGSRAFTVTIAMGKVQKTQEQIEQMEEALARKAVARI